MALIGSGLPALRYTMSDQGSADLFRNPTNVPHGIVSSVAGSRNRGDASPGAAESSSELVAVGSWSFTHLRSRTGQGESTPRSM